MSMDVLVVDDSATMRQMVDRTMRVAGLDVGAVFEAANGIEALALLAEHPVAVIIADLNMPHMTGIQLLRRMKSNDRLKVIPIVIVTTEGSQQRIEEMTGLGAFGYIRKPFHPEQLRDVLKPLVGVTDHARPAAPNCSVDAF
jgi:two-component system, chemotaxis family, chemotaxis protein CheY